MFHFINKIVRFFSSNNKNQELKLLLGFTPNNIFYYYKAFTPLSFKNTEQNNERLEFLGDSILGAIIAEYLFKKYPNHEEGFLTEMRCKIVNRKKLNLIGYQLKLTKIVQKFYNNDEEYNGINSQILGDILEALIGAIFLDKGYEFTNIWVYKNIIKPYIKFDELEQIDANIKNTLFAWASKNNKTVEFKLEKEILENNRKKFVVHCMINNEFVSEGTAFNKKDASIIATERALKKMSI